MTTGTADPSKPSSREEVVGPLDTSGRDGGEDDARPLVVAVDVGATNLRLAFVRGTELGEVVTLRTSDLELDPATGITCSLARLIADAAGDARLRPAAVGVAVATDVAREGIVHPRPFGLPRGTVLRDGLEAALGIPVVVANDANMAALGELRAGAGRGYGDFVVVTLGTNVGGGIVIDGKVVVGAHGGAGELGLLQIPAPRPGSGPTGPTVPRDDADGVVFTKPGRGCALLEDVVGGAALARSSADVDEPSSDGVFARAAAGDRRARAAVRRAVEGWALLIADVVAILDPEFILLSGVLVEHAVEVIDSVRRRAAELVGFPVPDIRVGELGAAAGLVGAAIAAGDLAGVGEER